MVNRPNEKVQINMIIKNLLPVYIAGFCHRLLGLKMLLIRIVHGSGQVGLRPKPNLT